MRSPDKSGEVRVELKYCERCGALWVRERGAGVVYCEKCQAQVDDLPIARKKPSRGARLPVARAAVVPEFGADSVNDDGSDLEGMGGAA